MKVIDLNKVFRIAVLMTLFLILVLCLLTKVKMNSQ